MSEQELKVIEMISRMSIDRASQVFSKTIKAGSKIEIVRFQRVDISEISEEVSKEDKEATGAIVQLSGEAPTKLLFIVNLKDALKLTDLFLRREIGETKAFDIYVESTIQEIGNILASSIANVFAKGFNVEMSPEPPVVLSDYSSSIFNTVLMDEDYLTDNKILLVETKFFVVRTAFDCMLFLMPSVEATKVLLERSFANNFS